MKRAGTSLNLIWKLSYKGEVYKWTAETPNLYDFTVESATQEGTVRCGFRRIEIKNKNFRVNNDNFSEIFFGSVNYFV